MGRYDNRNYMIITTDQTSSLNYSEVLEFSTGSLRINVAGTQTFVKYVGSTPDTITNIDNEKKSGPYSHSEILDILTSSAWTDIDYSK